jgi:hypothetical protein
LCAARKVRAAQFAGNILPIIRQVQAAGHTSFDAIAGQLNARKVATANGDRWRHEQADLDGSAGAKTNPPVESAMCPD